MNVELWFYPQTLNPNTRMIIGLVSTVDPTKQINIALSLTDINVTINTSSMSTNNSANIFTLNAWNFLNVDITNGNSSCLILYNSLANQATLSSTGPFSLFSYRTSFIVTIGYDSSNSPTYFDGYMRNIKIYSVNRSLSNILLYKYSPATDIYYTGTTYSSELKLFLPLNESADKINDLSFTNNTPITLTSTNYFYGSNNASSGITITRNYVSKKDYNNLNFILCEGDTIMDTNGTCIIPAPPTASSINYNNGEIKIIPRSIFSQFTLTNTYFIHLWFKSNVPSTYTTDFIIIGQPSTSDVSSFCSSTPQTTFALTYTVSGSNANKFNIVYNTASGTTNILSTLNTGGWKFMILDVNNYTYNLWINGIVPADATANYSTLFRNNYYILPGFNIKCDIFLGYSKETIAGNLQKPIFLMYNIGIANLPYTSTYYNYLYNNLITKDFVEIFYVDFTSLQASNTIVNQKIYNPSYTLTTSYPIFQQTTSPFSSNPPNNFINNNIYLRNFYGDFPIVFENYCPSMTQPPSCSGNVVMSLLPSTNGLVIPVSNNLKEYTLELVFRFDDLQNVEFLTMNAGVNKISLKLINNNLSFSYYNGSTETLVTLESATISNWYHVAIKNVLYYGSTYQFQVIWNTNINSKIFIQYNGGFILNSLNLAVGSKTTPVLIQSIKVWKFPLSDSLILNQRYNVFFDLISSKLVAYYDMRFFVDTINKLIIEFSKNSSSISYGSNTSISFLTTILPNVCSDNSQSSSESTCCERKTINFQDYTKSLTLGFPPENPSNLIFNEITVEFWQLSNCSDSNYCGVLQSVANNNPDSQENFKIGITNLFYEITINQKQLNTFNKSTIKTLVATNNNEWNHFSMSIYYNSKQGYINVKTQTSNFICYLFSSTASTLCNSSPSPLILNIPVKYP